MPVGAGGAITVGENGLGPGRCAGPVPSAPLAVAVAVVAVVVVVGSWSWWWLWFRRGFWFLFGAAGRG